MKKLLFITSLFLVIFIVCKQNSSNCDEPIRRNILNEAQLLIDNGEEALIFDESLLGTIDTIELFQGNFATSKGEYLAMCYSFEEHYPCMSYSHLSPPYETANYLLMKLSCSNGKWNIDWAAQENKLEKNNIIDIDGDGISEIIFQGYYDCNGGMVYGYYYIAKFIKNELVYLYEKEPIDQIAVLPNPNLEITEKDTVTLNLNIEFIDVDNDGIKELIEKTTVVVYNGGKTRKEILKKASITNNIDTLYIKNGKFISNQKNI